MVLQNSGRYVASSSTGENDGGSGESKTDLRLREIRDTEAIDSKYGFARMAGAQGRFTSVVPGKSRPM